MKINELRIGNLVYCPEMDTNDIVNKGHFNCPELYEPIPLTEEWFNREPDKIKEWKGNGADYQPETSKTVQKYYRLSEDVYCVFHTWSWRKDDNDEWNNEYSLFLNYWNNEIHLYKFEIHVLQNLYFALTGEELKLKE